MFRNLARRMRITTLVVLSLLFSQLALANYVCATVVPADHEEMAMEMAPGEPCEGMGAHEDQAVLCFQHCTNAPQSSDAVKLPTVSLPAVVQVLVVPLFLEASQQDAQAYSVLGAAQPPPEPIFLSTLRLRV